MKNYKQYIFLILVFLLMGFSHSAFADVLAQQNIITSKTSLPLYTTGIGGRGDVDQRLGNNLSGTLNTIQVKVFNETLNSDLKLDIQFYGFSDSNYTSYASSAPEPTCISNSVIAISGGYDGIVTCTYTPMTLNIGTYYVMRIINAFNQDNYIYGSSSDVYSGGNCQAIFGQNDICSPLLDIGFSMNGDFVFTPPASCTDGIQNQDETGIDTGGICTPQVVIPLVCTDGVMNGDETGIDDGGRCNTHFLGMTPLNGVTVTGPDITFTLDVWVNPKDINTFIGVNLNLHNIDQNVLLLGQFSPSDFRLLDEFRVPSAGLYHFSQVKAMGNGNYTLEATLNRAYLAGWIINPFSSINQTLVTQFIVGEGTFIGTVQQSGYDALNGTASGAIGPGGVATIASNCNPLSSSFDVSKCGIFLFTPGGMYFDKTMKDIKDGLLTRVPWGYFYRVFDIMSNPSKTSLPAITIPVQMGPGNTDTPGYENISFDPGDMIAGAGDLLDSIRDPFTHKNARDVFEPMVQLTIALAVVFVIIQDLTGHKHDGESTGKNKKLS